MAEAEKDLESKGSTTSLDRDNEAEDLSLIAVIDKNETIVRSGEKHRVKKIEKKRSIEHETFVSAKTEVILLDEAPAARDTRSIVKNGYNPRVIELSDKISKMELRREFKVDVANPEHSAGESGDSRRNVDGADDGSAEILSRLPPGTILIKQSRSNAATRSCSREDSDYVHDSSKDSTETNSSGSSSAASYTAAGKVKRIQHRTGRSKKIVEVRRNPVRNKKKKPIDEDFLRPRQRLLSVKRKAGFAVDTVARKRVKSTPTPYMNTRSVTRKMYTVGATYQAPTIHDAIEWKQWPAHGMHERPIWHPQVGLAFEYIDRNFVSLDGRTYREIIDEPVIEVVSVDPNPERMLLSSGKRKIEIMRPNNFFGTIDTGETNAIEQGKSFEACMHGSLHSVLAYCSRVVTPAYKKNVDTKCRRISQNSDILDNSKTAALPKLSSDVATSSREENKIGIQSLLPATSSRTIIPETSQLPSTSSSSEISKCLVLPRRTISFTNVRNMQGNILQEVFNRSSKNTLIFLKPTDPPSKPEKMCTKTSSTKLNQTIVKDSVENVTAEMNLTKLDDNAISDEALMEMSSIYKKLLPNDKTEPTSANSSKASVDAIRPITASVTAKVSKMSSEEVRDNRTGSTSTDVVCPPRLSCSNQAAEIAKILAEYNEKAAKNLRPRRACYPSSSVKTPGTKTAKLDKECSNVKNNRTTYLSLVEQPKNPKIKRDDDSGNESSTYRGSSLLAKQEISKSPAEVISKSVPITIPIKAEDAGKNTDVNIRAIDLTTAKPRISKEEQSTKSNNPDESMNQQWLQELIEDTALLYCAAAGVHQNDVADYLNTLDSSQSIQWLGS